jgi:hypothetical protein
MIDTASPSLATIATTAAATATRATSLPKIFDTVPTLEHLHTVAMTHSEDYNLDEDYTPENGHLDWKIWKLPLCIQPTVEVLIILVRLSFQLLEEVWNATWECSGHVARLYEEIFLLHSTSLATLSRMILHFGLLSTFCGFALVARAFTTISRWIDAVIETRRGPPLPPDPSTSRTSVHFGELEMVPTEN